MLQWLLAVALEGLISARDGRRSRLLWSLGPLLGLLLVVGLIAIATR